MLLFILCFICSFFPSLASTPVEVSVNWGHVTYISNTHTTLQCVVNPLYERGSSIHDQTFQALENIGADYVRFQGWDPYPHLVVGELEPPTGNPVCGSAIEGESLCRYLGCYEGVFENIDFAAYGNPGGRCGEFTTGKCNSPIALEVVQKICLGKQNCSIPVSSQFYNINCTNTARLAVQATCSSSVNKTFWNFTLMDPILEDFMNAQKNHSVIVNFCVTPEWLWNTPAPVVVPPDPNVPFWSYSQGHDLRDPSNKDIVDYYKRLIQWYTAGGFFDEYDVFHESGHNYHFPYFEIFNEMDLGGHGGSEFYRLYTQLYDSIAIGMKEIQPNMEIVGGALGSASSSDPTTFIEWAEYFLNTSNHAPDAPLEWFSYHFYGLPKSRTNGTEFETLFEDADHFLSLVSYVQEIVRLNAPWVKTTIDELGVILPNDNAPNPGNISDIYWNAAGAMYAYIFGNLIQQDIAVIGMSQMIGYPSQYPSVSMMDWDTGKPNSRYWVLYLLHESFHVGDQLAETSSSNITTLYAQGFITPKGQVILIVNKSNQPISVILNNCTIAELTYVDLTTYESPPSTIVPTSNTFVFNAFAVGVVTIL